jgi:hypothetical protein
VLAPIFYAEANRQIGAPQWFRVMLGSYVLLDFVQDSRVADRLAMHYNITMAPVAALISDVLATRVSPALIRDKSHIAHPCTFVEAPGSCGKGSKSDA